MKNSSLLLLFNFGILFYFVWTLASRFIAIALLLSNFGRVLFQGSFTWYLCLHQTSNFFEPVLRQIVHWDITVFQETVDAKTFFQDKICIIFNYLRSREMWTGSVIFQPLWVRIKAGQTWTANIWASTVVTYNAVVTDSWDKVLFRLITVSGHQ